MTDYAQQLDQLARGEMVSLTIAKEDFLAFREVLLKHPQFKQFRGEALQGATIVYTSLQEARA